MAEAALRQFSLDYPRVDLWLDDGHVDPVTTATSLVGDLFRCLPPLAAWRAIDLVSQGSIAPWYESASDTFARGPSEHLLSRGRQRVAIDTVNSQVRIEKDFAVVTLVDGEAPRWGATKRLYLVFDCTRARRTRSVWQHAIQDGVLLLA